MNYVHLQHGRYRALIHLVYRYLSADVATHEARATGKAGGSRALPGVNLQPWPADLSSSSQVGVTDLHAVST